jgi:hypothetical protein
MRSAKPEDDAAHNSGADALRAGAPLYRAKFEKACSGDMPAATYWRAGNLTDWRFEAEWCRLPASF